MGPQPFITPFFPSHPDNQKLSIKVAGLPALQSSLSTSMLARVILDAGVKSVIKIYNIEHKSHTVL